MATRKLRNESSTEGKTIWKAVEVAAARAPEWVKERALAAASESSSDSSAKEKTK